MTFGHMWLARWIARGESFSDLIGPSWFRRWLVRGDHQALAGSEGFRRAVSTNFVS